MNTPILISAYEIDIPNTRELTNSQIRSVHSSKTLYTTLHRRQLLPAQHFGQASQSRDASLQSEDQERKRNPRVVSDQGWNGPDAQREMVDQLEESKSREP
jgi:hypothetical protein